MTTNLWNHITFPQSQSFSRSHHRLCMVHNLGHKKQVVIFGGQKKILCSDTTHSIDFASMKWDPEIEIPRDHGPPPRIHHDMALSRNQHKIYMFGGWKGSAHCNDLWRYDSELSEWNYVKINNEESNTPCKRRFHSFDSIEICGEEFMILVGGIRTDGTILNDIWIFDPRKLIWISSTARQQSESPLPQVFSHSASVVSQTSQCTRNSSLVYLFGGIGKFGYHNNLWQIDTYSMNACRIEYEAIPRNPEERFSHTSFYAGYGYIIIYGGDNTDTACSDISVYDTDSGTMKVFSKPLEINGKELWPSRMATDLFPFQDENKAFMLFGLDHNRKRVNDGWILSYDAIVPKMREDVCSMFDEDLDEK